MFISNKQLIPFQEKYIKEFIEMKIPSLIKKFPDFVQGKSNSTLEMYIRERIKWANQNNFYQFSSISFFIDFELSFSIWHKLLIDRDFQSILNAESSDETEKLNDVRSVIIRKYLSKN